MDNQVAGSCLCGKVSSTITGDFQRFYQCFCSRCQKKTGSAFASLIFTSPESIKWHSGKKLIKRFDLPNAIRFSNCFCTGCGSQVPYLSRDGVFLVIPAGYLEGNPQIIPQASIFWDERPCWFDDGKVADTFSRYSE
jgi:hypothetical protein